MDCFDAIFRMERIFEPRSRATHLEWILKPCDRETRFEMNSRSKTPRNSFGTNLTNPRWALHSNSNSFVLHALFLLRNSLEILVLLLAVNFAVKECGKQRPTIYKRQGCFSLRSPSRSRESSMKKFSGLNYLYFFRLQAYPEFFKWGQLNFSHEHRLFRTWEWTADGAFLGKKW